MNALPLILAALRGSLAKLQAEAMAPEPSHDQGQTARALHHGRMGGLAFAIEEQEALIEAVEALTP